MTASRTRRSRLESCSARVISSNLVTTSEVRQVGGECVETQPAKGGEPDVRRPVLTGPACVDPRSHVRQLRFRHIEAAHRAKPEVDRFGLLLLRLESLA